LDPSFFSRKSLTRASIGLSISPASWASENSAGAQAPGRLLRVTQPWTVSAPGGKNPFAMSFSVMGPTLPSRSIMSRTFQTGGTGVKMVRSRFGIGQVLILFKAGVTDKTDNIGRVWFFDFHPASANGAAHGSVLHQLDGLEAGLFQERFDHGGTEGFFEGFTIERLAGAGDDVGGILVALEVRALFQQEVAEFIGTVGEDLDFLPHRRKLVGGVDVD